MKKPNVLFLCTGNSARSQMAEGLLRQFAGDQFEAHSAGTAPKAVNPFAIRAMDEIGIDISRQNSKPVTEYLGHLPVRYLVVVCDDAERRCPTAWPGVASRLSWPFEDPAAAEGSDEQKLEKFREVRDAIAAKIQSWISEMDHQT